MRVTILGHASLFFETGSERILLDPVLRTTSLLDSAVHQYPRRLDLENIPTPTLLVITHEHYDHFDPETLEKLSKDIPVVIPPDQRMERQLRELGFSQFVQLDAWQQTTHGSVRLTATPSEADVTEFGLIVETEGARLWHMSDAEPPEDTAPRVLAQFGSPDVVTVKYQPPDPLLNFVHNLASTFDRRSVAHWLETACACSPKLAFPYASGLCLSREHAWMNRFAYPFSPEYVAELLARRLAGDGASTTVKPGDVLAIEHGTVRIERQASNFVRQLGDEIEVEWEPIEAHHLVGIEQPAAREALREDVKELIVGGEFSRWLKAHPKLLNPFFEWQVVCQFAVHLGDHDRIYFQADFTRATPEARLGKNPAASYFMHIGGHAASRVLSGEAHTSEVMYQGSVRIFERILAVRDGHMDAPAVKHMYGNFPDPFLCYANMRARKLARQATELSETIAVQDVL